MTTTEPDLKPDDAPVIDEPTEFRISVFRHAGTALLIVSAVALAFWGLGNAQNSASDMATTPRGEVVIGTPEPQPDEPAVDTPDDTPDADDAQDPASEVEDAPDPEDDGDPADPADTTPAEETTSDGGTSPGDGDGDGDGQAPDADAEQDGASETGTENDAGTEPDPPADAEAVDPATVTVQVLDGFQQDGGAAADAVADSVVGAGYNLVARNPALLYDATTVLYTAGNEDAAAQVAALIGTGSIREQPGNLSTEVAIHIVVGSDRG